MNFRESAAAAGENVGTSDYLMGLNWLVVMLTFANFVMMTFVFADQLTPHQTEAVFNFAKVGVMLLAGFPAIAYLAGFFEEFELRSTDQKAAEDQSESDEAEADAVRFESESGEVEDVESGPAEGSA